MRYILILILLLPVSFNSYSQKKKKKKYPRIYTDENKVEKLRINATFYIDKEVEEENEDYEIIIQKMYYMDGRIHEKFRAIHDKLNFRYYRDGLCTEFYPNGKIKSETNYEEGKIRGEFKDFFADGMLRKLGYQDSSKLFIYSFTDTSGNELVKNGIGKFIELNKNINNFVYYEVVDSIVELSYFIDQSKGDTIYIITDVPIEPLEGWDSFYTKMKYALMDVDIMKFGYSNFRITCTLNENGEPEDVKLIKMKPREDDIKVINFFKQTARFKEPVLRDGRKVKVWIELPFRIM
jgi:antitoxin component YwqK of YwqJK toxin-antitoxin module